MWLPEPMPVNPSPRQKKPQPPPAPPPRYVLLSEFDFGKPDVNQFAQQVRQCNQEVESAAIRLGVARSCIDTTNFDTLTDAEYAGILLAAPRKKRMSRNGIEFEIEQALPENDDQRLRRMLAEDVKAELQHPPTIISPAPQSRPVLTACIYTWTWLRVIYRELYGAEHLRRYL